VLFFSLLQRRRSARCALSGWCPDPRDLGDVLAESTELPRDIVDFTMSSKGHYEGQMGDLSLFQKSTAGLFQPWDLANLRVSNRFAMAPMSRWSSPDGVPGVDVADYYARRARGGVGLIITEGTYVADPSAGPDLTVPRMYGNESLAGWARVVDAVHAAGTAIIPQLWHLGAERGVAPELFPATASVSPSGIAPGGRSVGRGLLTALDLERAIGGFATAAANAMRTGFDGIELHGAHGYLLDEFLWHSTNLRTDEYGGAAASRARFPAAVVEAIRGEVGVGFPIVFRFSQWKNADYTATIADSPSELKTLLDPLARAGVDAFHVSTRRYWEPAFPTLTGADGRLGLAGWTKRITGLPVITVGQVGMDNDFSVAFEQGGLSGLASIEPLLMQFAAGQFDAVALGRALLADPDWVNKVRAGRFEDLIPFRAEHREVLW
jgi:2,4-dienoyl-CoA reductase-like NADH-dependent reductase (Old Yellow Enzyme family)